MTKPNEFIANSDYLSLAQKNTLEYTVIFPNESVPSGTNIVRTHDITVPSINGAIDEIMVARNGGNYLLGNYLVIEGGPPSLSIYLFRPSPNTLRVRLFCSNGTVSSWTMPTQTLNIRVSSFLPPNVF